MSYEKKNDYKTVITRSVAPYVEFSRNKLENLQVVILCLLIASTFGFSFFNNFPLLNDAITEVPVVIHHRDRKHHIRHKHRRRSLSSKEEAKIRRNKQVMLTKPIRHTSAAASQLFAISISLMLFKTTGLI
uniref:Ovule protein n=1 Tax=Heterorhabditis bacteriophora TaxID=37862 RepID=A0A1I7WXX6_HETBA